MCSITYLLTQATPPWRVRASCLSWQRGTRWVKIFLKKITLLRDDLKLFIIVFIYLLADSSVQFRRGHLWRPQGFAQLLPLCRSAGKRYMTGEKVAKANHFFLSHTALLQRPAMNSNNHIDDFIIILSLPIIKDEHSQPHWRKVEKRWREDRDVASEFTYLRLKYKKSFRQCFLPSFFSFACVANFRRKVEHCFLRCMLSARLL